MIWDQFWDSILKGDYLLAFFQLIMGVIITIVNIILYPFSLLISSLMPALDDGLSSIAQYFDYAATYIAFAINAAGIPAVAVTIIAGYYMFVFVTTFTVWTVKLLVKWKGALWG